MPNMLREALSHMNESSAESAKNPTNGTEEPGESAGGGDGGLQAVHYEDHGGKHSMHRISKAGTSESSMHGKGEVRDCPLCGGSGKS